MKLKNELTDEALIGELGERLAHQRVLLGMTQANLAKQSGVSRATVERLEAGSSVQLTNLMRVLRSLGLLDRVDAAVPAIEPTPIELLERGGKRQRVRSSEKKKGAREWRWGDEQ